jgi:predicted nucleic acid-binding protein
MEVSTMLVVDTDILIDAGRNIGDAVAYLELAEKNQGLAISAITQMELLIGARNRQAQRDVQRFLARFSVIKLSDAMTDTAYDLLLRYRLSHGLAIADALIAATAIVAQQSFVTKNRGDFKFIQNLLLKPYP